MKAIVGKNPNTNEVVTVLTSANGKTYGKIRVDQTHAVVKNGYSTFENRSAFLPIGEKDLAQAKTFFKEGMEYPAAGRIVRTETREPQFEGHKAKIIPADLKTGREEAPYLLDGASVYFQDKWETDLSIQDVLLSGSKIATTVEQSSEE